MTRKVVKEVTSPVHGPDGFSLAYAPGEQFGQDHELPPDVPWRWETAEIPEEPEPEAKPEPPKPAARQSSGRGA